MTKLIRNLVFACEVSLKISWHMLSLSGHDVLNKSFSPGSSESESVASYSAGKVDRYARDKEGSCRCLFKRNT